MNIALARRNLMTLCMMCVGIAFLVGAMGCREKKSPVKTSELPSNNSLRFSGQPIPHKEVFPKTSVSSTEFDNASAIFENQLQQLADFAEELRRGQQATRPSLIAEQFEATLLERDKLRSAYLGERIRIARWRLSKQTPTYYEDIALDRLFRTLLAPWNGASRFRIEFKVHVVRDRPNYYDAQVLVNIEGKVPAQSVRADGGKNEIGRTAIGLWQMVWQKSPDSTPPKIKKINMLAHEETVNFVVPGQLFVDCTESVLRNDSISRERLSYGLDQWSNRIPGIDAIGNNGLAIGDFNNDGLDDIYVCQPHSMPNMLLRQNPDGTADDMAIAAGVNLFDESKSALIVDFDNDGHQDLAVATENRLVLFSNKGDGTFQLEHQLKIGAGIDSLSAADYDQDGDLDLFVAKYRPVSKFDDIFPQPNSNINANNGGRNILLRNEEAWKFNDVTSDAGFTFNNQYYTTSAIWNDFDTDGDLDLYLANDFQQDCLFVNDKGWFTDSYKANFASSAARTSTASIGDFNFDGQPDFIVGTNASFDAQRVTRSYIDTGGKLLREAKGHGASSRIVYADEPQISTYSFRAPIYSSESTYSSVVGDFNNDGMEDYVATNGWISGKQQRSCEANYLRNLFNPANDLDVISKNDVFQTHHEISDWCRQGASFDGYQRNSCILTIGAMRFANISNTSGLNFLDDSRAIVRTDWDGDGDLDLVINNRNAPRLRILQNQYASKNGFLKLRLHGTSSNRDAIGSRVEVYRKGHTIPLVRMLTAGSGRKSQSSKVLHFGLGKAAIDQVKVVWPNGQSQMFEDITANGTYVLTEGETDAAEHSNDRYRIALDPKPIQPQQGLPSTERIRFFPTTRLPIVQYREPTKSKRKKWYQIETNEGRPLLCIFCPYELDCQDLLRDWNVRQPNISKMNGDLLVVFTGNNSDTDYELELSKRQIESTGFGFRWGVLSESGNAKMAQCFGQWFFNFSLPEKPFGLLLDADGNVHYGYSFEQLNWETIEGDFQNLADKNFEVDHVPDRDNEMWIVKNRTPRFDRLAVRFAEIGYDRDASAFERYLPPLQSDDYLRRALDLASKGNLTSAMSAAERSLELNPKSVDAMIALAQITAEHAKNADQQARTRMLLTAGDLLDEAIEIQPTNPEAILARAEVFRLQRDIENALNLLTKYLQVDPDNWEVHAIVGRLYFHKNEDLQATKFLITAIENRPTLPYVAGDLGYLYLINRQFDDAKAFLDLATRLHPSDDKPKRHLAEAKFWLGDFENSGRLLEATVTSQPTLSHSKQLYAFLKACSPFSNFRDGKVGLSVIDPFVDLKGERSPISLEIKAACLAEIGDFDAALETQLKAISSVENQVALEKYTREQFAAMRDRLELYKRKRVYRIKDPTESPIPLLGGL